jgi:catechol 2,3-dioxygenase
MKVQSLGHIVLRVRNQQAAEDFYHGVLGFPVVARNRDFAMTFFSFGNYHHHFAVIAVGEDAKPAPEGALGLFHAAFKIGDKLDELRAAKDHLEAAGINVLARDHIVTKSIYFEDPDGNPLELYVEGSDEWKHNPDIIAKTGKDLDL